MAGWNCWSPGSEGSGGARMFPWAQRPELAATQPKGAWHQGQGPGHLKRKWGLEERPLYRAGGGKETRGIKHINSQKGRGWVAVRGGGADLQAHGAVPPAGWDPALRTSRAGEGEKEGGVWPGGQAAGGSYELLCAAPVHIWSGRCLRTEGGGGADWPGPRREGVRGRCESLETRQRERTDQA